MKTIAILLLSIILTIANGCKKFVTIDPPDDQIVNPKPFTNDATATETITGIYSEMMNGTNQFSSGYTSLLEGLYADELYYYTPGRFDEFTASNISQTNHGLIESSFWIPMYKYIYAANLALEQLKASTVLTSAVKQRLSGEALFIRVFCYDYLVDIFGDVPLELTSSYKVNMNFPRTSQYEVYKQMVNDIKEAIDLLPDDYPEPERTRPNKWAAKTLLARIQLETNDYSNAAITTSEVIANNQFHLDNDLSTIFQKESAEAIWQLQPVLPNYNTTEGNLILPANNNTQPSFLITTKLLDAFEEGDLRKAAWIKSRVFNGKILFYPFKYKVRTSLEVSENYVVMRLAELYLIRAEANAQLGNLEIAVKDINVIRARAGLKPTTANDLHSILQAIEQERRMELCFEWGHRWFDLKRTGRAATVLSIIKPDWVPSDTLWPIPIGQINLNPALTQNKGY
ncbi:RagB/SusD family nutrient uptake outer membrane protein [Pinibacter aurantiacus]|uniref:RagB/SusD family nutrient uptake outer membrane protein n=1 Tax=Pinibacter aurantiacus TaxID=2851599 RepID=A0A9E2W2H3_9BACT|nr:RagB/SusD family nutrient uptake outer membrane protein [Pinibacter aurantiacus]MBV4357330.1 RagB/SusD family nutrient uptake outer membrane protein [Pinibacter aurantiacus]